MVSNPGTKPVFYSPDSSRWKRFLWVIKILAVLIIIGIASILISLFHKQVFKLPTLRERLVLSQKENMKYKSGDIKLAETKRFVELAKEARKHQGHDFLGENSSFREQISEYR